MHDRHVNIGFSPVVVSDGRVMVVVAIIKQVDGWRGGLKSNRSSRLKSKEIVV